MGNINAQIRHDLDKIIVPTKHEDVPIIPNIFLEAKAPQGGGEGWVWRYGRLAMMERMALGLCTVCRITAIRS